MTVELQWLPGMTLNLPFFAGERVEPWTRSEGKTLQIKPGSFSVNHHTPSRCRILLGSLTRVHGFVGVFLVFLVSWLEFRKKNKNKNTHIDWSTAALSIHLFQNQARWLGQSRQLHDSWCIPPNSWRLNFPAPDGSFWCQLNLEPMGEIWWTMVK